MRKTVSVYGLTFSMPMLLWQLIFFLAPLVFLIALSFWSVRNFRMEPDFNPDNWSRMLGRSVFWEAYFRTLLLSASAAVLTSALAFPASYAIAFKLSDAARRWAIFLMVIPFFTSYLVRVYSWQIFLSDNGIINAALAPLGLGPFPMLNSTFGTMVGYLTLCLPLVILLQLFSLIFVDRTLIEAAHNLRCARLRTVFEVVVPAARVGLTIAALFCFPNLAAQVGLGGPGQDIKQAAEEIRHRRIVWGQWLFRRRRCWSIHEIAECTLDQRLSLGIRFARCRA